MSLKANIIANYLGQGWRALMSLAFVPLYIHYLGIEAYGLIGLFAVLQAWLTFLDMGLRPVLSREMARFIGGAHDAQSIADLLRSTELIALSVAILFAAIVWASSGWLATDWVRTREIATPVVAQAFALMGLVAGLQFMESLFTSALAGLQRQVLQNAIAGFIATLRAVGAVGVLMWISPTILAFFVWQGLVSAISVVLFVGAVYTRLPRPTRPARFSTSSVRAVCTYAGGMVGIALLSFLLTQIDKILLSRQLPLDQLGHYLLAGVVAGSMSIVATPIGAAYYPRLTELVARGDGLRLREAFHQVAQLTALPLVAAAVMMMMFGDRLLLAWTHDATLSRDVAPLLCTIAIGTMFNGFMSVPYLLQLAHGWTSLSIKISCVAVVVLVPAILILVPRFGAMAAAVIWATLNVAYVLVGAQFMFVRLLGAEKRSWYVQDIALPLLAAVTAGVVLRALLPTDGRLVYEIAYLAVAAVCVFGAAASACPFVIARASRRAHARPQPLNV